MKRSMKAKVLEDYGVFRRSGALLRNFVIKLYKALGSSIINLYKALGGSLYTNIPALPGTAQVSIALKYNRYSFF